MNHVTRSALSPALCRTVAPELLRDETLAEIFAATARMHPTRPAAIFDGQTVSYEELSRRSDQVAGALVRQGIGRGDFVGLWMERSLDLHVALLAILKTGAAYLPFDADAPAARIADCLADCRAKALIVDAERTPRAGDQPAPVLRFAGLADDRAPAPLPDLRDLGMGPDDPAYVIYTSGSTGQPKGVVISHRNICHYLRAANSLYGVGAEDVMFQGASVAFDLSLEEIFLPYLTGARLWIAPRRLLQDSDRLAETLGNAGITVMSAVPTLLGMISSDIPSLRLIILGGEACPPGLADRWCRPGRKVLNSYGPTETTVVATVAEVLPGQPITIGEPIPNYSCYVVDETLQPVEPGVEGELLIGGPGVAAGYLNRPQLTAEKFIANPFDDREQVPLLYRSGDAVCVDSQGQLLFRGRIDDQVKIRGYRVELGEIEARLSQYPGVRQAAVAVSAQDGVERLAAFIVAEPGAAPDAVGLRRVLGGQMPCYMVPSHYELVADLPRLSSGKVDRKALQKLPLSAAPGDDQEAPASPTEAVLLAAAQKVFPGQSIPFEADFFVDLGGHSLIAARFVSSLRTNPAFAGLTMQEIYAWRTLRAIAAGIDRGAAGQAGQARQAQSMVFEPPPLIRRFLCGLAQAVALPVILSLSTAPWLGVFIAYDFFSGESPNFWREMAVLLVAYAAINLVIPVIAVAAKWLVIGRTKPGRYPLWGVYYFRWWLAQRFIGLIHFPWFQGTPILSLVLRSLGAEVGRDSVLQAFETTGAVDLVSIGSGVAIGSRTGLSNAEVVGNELLIGRITIGDEASIGSLCNIGRDAVIGRGAELGNVCAVPAGSVIGDWETWEGSPARRTGTVDQVALPEPAVAGRARKLLFGGIYAIVMFLMPPLTLIPIIPAFRLMDSLGDRVGDLLGVDYVVLVPLTAMPTALLFTAVTVAFTVVIRWTVLPRLRPGSFSVHSWLYLRHWIVAQAVDMTLGSLSCLYATVYMGFWYRLMGAKVGRDVEISTKLGGRYDLIEIGQKSFIADEVLLGDEHIARGWVTVDSVRVGERVFVGNNAVIPGGYKIPAGSLIGISSQPPLEAARMSEGDTWFGSPPIKLPLRQRFDDVAAHWTYEPTRLWRLWRAMFEAFRISLPSMLWITFGSLVIEGLGPIIESRNIGALMFWLVVCSVGVSFGMAFTAIALKWILMGVYRPTVRPMWSWWALRTETVAVANSDLADRGLFEHLRGTPFLPWMVTLFGARFGKGVFLDSVDFTEFDCVEVGDFCAINAGAALQTHLYEDRVMKVGRIKLGRGVKIGSQTTVLYDSSIGDFARVGGLSVIMKGEDLPPDSSWQGFPAQPSMPGGQSAAQQSEAADGFSLTVAAGHRTNPAFPG
ncbi:MAG TPA: amino acid adenylation domain-containing protein [Rhodospirillaceae bacterium]|nr:amino acid adenylation domain-containing protein [Rhodospirillaceae bacterium]